MTVPRGTLDPLPWLDDASPLPGPAAAKPPPNPALEGEILGPAFSRKGKQDLVGRSNNRISKRLRAAVGHVANGMNISQAAKAAGIHRNSLGLSLQRPHVLALLEQTVKLNLSTSAAKAASRLDTLINGARSEYVQLEASKAVLDRAGYAQPTAVSLGGDVVIEIKL